MHYKKITKVVLNVWNIPGFLVKNSKITQQKLFDYLKKLTKSGPDSRKLDFKDFNFGDFVSGHTRLSIIISPVKC